MISESNLMQHLEVQRIVFQITLQRTILPVPQKYTIDGSPYTIFTVNNFTVDKGKHKLYKN